MNNFNAIPMCYQFWMLPNFVATRRPYYPPFAFYSQMINPQLNNLIVQNVLPLQTKNLVEQPPKNFQEPQVKPPTVAPTQKSQVLKTSNQQETSITKLEVKKEQVKKANRPLTYLTQKAYYLKQKLKEKQNNGLRILRKRLKPKEVKINKSEEQEKNEKKVPQSALAVKKKLPIAKDSEREQKIVNRIKIRLARENLYNYAAIPKQISGITSLNEFCRTKYENLMLRQFNQN